MPYWAKGGGGELEARAYCFKEETALKIFASRNFRNPGGPSPFSAPATCYKFVLQYKFPTDKRDSVILYHFSLVKFTSECLHLLWLSLTLTNCHSKFEE